MKVEGHSHLKHHLQMRQTRPLCQQHPSQTKSSHHLKKHVYFIPHNSSHKRTFTIPMHSPRTAIALVIQLQTFASNKKSFQGLLSSPGTCLRSPSITRCMACLAAQTYTNWILPFFFMVETIGSPKILWRIASLLRQAVLNLNGDVLCISSMS